MTVTVKPHLFVDIERLWGIFKSSRYKVLSSNRRVLLTGQVHDINAFHKTRSVFERSNDVRHRAEAMVERNDVVGVLCGVPSHPYVGKKYFALIAGIVVSLEKQTIDSLVHITM